MKQGFSVLAIAAALTMLTTVYGQSSPPIPSRQHDPQKLETLTIPLEVHGFLKKALTVPQGYYFIAIVNQTGDRQLQFAFERMPGASTVGAASASIFNETVNQYTGRFGRTVRLDPGTYRLSVKSRPTWICSIDVK